MRLAADLLARFRRLLRSAAERPPYAEWLEHRIARRAKAYRLPATPPTFAVLTAVYEKSDAAFLRDTAASVERQSLPCAEWIILAQGTLSPAMRDLLEDLKRHDWVKVHRHPRNLGIVRGMRLCLEAARADYVAPVDGDDTLTEDALQVLASILGCEPRPVFAYSDEDLLIEGVPSHPYWRPGWDEVLNLETSYVWHLCAFHRETALALGVYSDAGADWCQDWDTVTRFANAGQVPLHVPEVLYHWRQHPASSTNRPGSNPDSLRSTQHVLARQIARQPDPARFNLEHFPINRGVPEWYISRRRIAAPPADLVVLATGTERVLALLGSIERLFDYRPASIVLCTGVERLDRQLEQAARSLCDSVRHAPAYDVLMLAQLLREPGSSIVWLCSDSILFEDDRSPWEALRLMELHPRVKTVCGRLVDRTGRIADAGAVLSFSGEVNCPWRGWAEMEPGDYALALKPHTVKVPTPDLLFAQRDFLAAALRSVTPGSSIATLGLCLGAAASAAEVLVAYSPLVRARAVAPLLAHSGPHALAAPYRKHRDGECRRSTAHHEAMRKLYR